MSCSKLLIIGFLTTIQINAQIQVCLGTDATLCPGQTLQITNCTGVGGPVGTTNNQAYTQTSIPYAPDPLTNGTSVTLSDDSQTAMLPIGFSFCYFGNVYTNFIIGSNNYITFSSGGSTTWVTTVVPNGGGIPKNAIMGPWQDINPGIGGTVKYAVYGTAPYRRLAVSWRNIPMFSCTNQLYSSQIIIYETTNIIETHILNKGICSVWNGGKAVHALHNINGSTAIIVPGRNNTAWATTNNGIRFSPGTVGLEWANTLGQTFPYNDGILNINPVPSSLTGYYLKSTCGSIGAVSDTTWLSQSNVNATISPTTDFCSSSIGSATATTTAGTGPFQYLWTPSNQTTPTASNLSAGNYEVLITDSYGCTKAVSVVVGNTTATYSGSTTQVSCQGGSDGTATATMTPAIGTVTYNWFDAGGQTTQTAVGLSAGTYNCAVSSNLGCTDTVQVTITEIAPLVVQLFNQQAVSCNGGNDGIVVVSVSGGTPQYTYSWNNSTSNSSFASDLTAGAQSVTITDLNNCSTSLSTIINEPTALSITGSTLVSCSGGNNGTATASMTSILGVVSYNWYDASGQTTATATGLSAGTYHCEATSTVGCVDTVQVVISEIPALTATLSQQDVTCNGGNNGYIAINPSGGTPQYFYSWDNSSSNGPTANDLVVGPHTITITDANNCVYSISASLAEPTALSISATTTVTCAGGTDGTATASMTSLLGTVSYNWYDAGGQTTATAIGLSPGTYHCAASSTVGCNDTVAVVITESPALVVQLTTQTISCSSGNTGSISAAVSGGTPEYSYLWNTGTTNSSLLNLTAGTYSVTVTDLNNCSTTVNAILTEPAPLSLLSLTSDQTICPGNSTTLIASGAGGNSAYTYTWSENGTVIGTGAAITVTPATTNSNYCVVLTEACGSPSVTDCMTITFPTPIVPSFTVDKTTSCEPGTFVFTNTTTNSTDIASILLEFGDGQSELFANGTTSVSHVYQDPQTYDLYLTVTSIFGCAYTVSMNEMVTVIANPVAAFNLSANPTTIFETTILMQNYSSDGVSSWSWNSSGSIPAASTEENPTFHFPEGVVDQYPIQLVVITPEGCIDSIEHILTVNSAILFFAPNAFTPDGDAHNQTWGFSVSGIDEYNFELFIFNRWGEIIWETHDIHSSWDGTYHGEVVQEGQFTWIARVKDLYSDNKQEFTGSILVLR